MPETVMKDLPLQEQPYEKFRQLGCTSLTDAELLSIIVGSGSRGLSALTMCRQILSLPECKGLAGLSRMKLSGLTSLKGIGPVKAMKLACIGELSRRIARENASASLDLTDPETVAEYFMEDFRHDDAEKVVLLLLNSRSRLVGEEVISRGTVNMSAVSPREIFLTALRYGAVSIILMHNHPSGDPSPSGEDLSLTAQVEQAGKLIGIELVDHIIMGDQRYFSFRQYGLM